MSIRDLVPGRRKGTLVRKNQGDLLEQFHSEFDQLFEDFFGEFGMPLVPRDETGRGITNWPRVNVSETDKEVLVTAELPGVEEKDISVELDGDMLTIRGQSQTEREQRDKRWTRIERRSGRFERSLHLPAAVLTEKSDAKYKNGVLTIVLEKAEPKQSKRKRIAVQTS